MFRVNIDFFKLKKKVLLTYLVKVLTFSQTVDFLIKMLTFLTYAKMREVMGQNWNKKCMRGKNGNKKNVGAKLGYDKYKFHK